MDVATPLNKVMKCFPQQAISHITMEQYKSIHYSVLKSSASTMNHIRISNIFFSGSMAGLSVDLTPGPGSTTAGSTDYSITCTVTEIGFITPSITWRSPGDVVISTDTDFTVGAVTGSGPTYSSVLMFKSLKTSQAGEYTCTAELDPVTDISSTTVNVTGISVCAHVRVCVCACVCVHVCVCERGRGEHSYTAGKFFLYHILCERQWVVHSLTQCLFVCHQYYQMSILHTMVGVALSMLAVS